VIEKDEDVASRNLVEIAQPREEIRLVDGNVLLILLDQSHHRHIQPLAVDEGGFLQRALPEEA
jgi:hypothetical protein